MNACGVRSLGERESGSGAYGRRSRTVCSPRASADFESAPPRTRAIAPLARAALCLLCVRWAAVMCVVCV